MFRSKLIAAKKESQTYREKMDRQIQQILMARQQVSTFEEDAS